MDDLRPLVCEISDISRGFFTDFIRRNQDSVRIFDACDQRVFNLKRLSLEVFHRLFREPHPKMPDPQAIAPENRWALTLHQRLTDQPEFDLLLEHTDSDFMAAGLATMTFMDAVAASLPTPRVKASDPAQLREEIKRLMAEGKPGNQARIEQLTRMGREAVAEMASFDEALADSRELRTVLGQCIDKATEMVEALASAEQVLGWGSGEGSSLKVSSEERLRFAEELMRNPSVKAILKIAGRMLEAAAQKRRSRDAIGMGELAGVTMGDDISRVLPSEIQKLAFPQLRPLFYLQYLEKTLLEYEMKGQTEQTRGPLVLCIDVSGSMQGHREFWAKALVLAFMKLARVDKRHLRIIHFASDVVHTADIDPAVPRFEDVLHEIGAWYNGGGTNFFPPLRSALEAIERREHMKRADVVFLTDGESAELPAKFKKRLSTRKEELGFTIYGILLQVNSFHARELLGSFCDHVINASDLHSADEIRGIF